MRNVRLRRTFLISKTRVRRRSCRSRVVAEAMGRRFSALELSKWLWGTVRKRLRRSERRCSTPFGRSEAPSDLSNARTPQNQGTVLLALECKCAFGAKNRELCCFEFPLDCEQTRKLGNCFQSSRARFFSIWKLLLPTAKVSIREL